MKHWLSESFNSVSLHVTQYYHTVINIFDLSRAIWCHVLFDQVCITVSYCFSRLEDTSNYSASVLQTNFAKGMSSITGRGIESQIPYVSWQSYLPDYDNHFISCFLILPPNIGLRWCPDAVIIFLIYLLIHISIVKHPKQNKWFKNSGTINQCYVPSSNTLLYNGFAHAFGYYCSFLRLLSKITHSFACKSNRMSHWSLPINWNNNVCLVT